MGMDRRARSTGHTDIGAEGAGYRYYVLVLLSLTSLFSVADRLVFSILLEDIRFEFSFSDTQLGLLGGVAFTITYVIAGFPAARLADRSIRKTIVAAAISFWSIMTALCGAAAPPRSPWSPIISAARSWPAPWVF